MHIKPPAAYFGGKSHAVTWYLALLPPHHTYVEVCGGMAAVLFAKSPSPVEVYNDVDEGLVGLFRVLRDPVQCAALEARLALTPYSREECAWSRDTWAGVEDPVERAARWYVLLAQGFSSHTDGKHGWSFSVTESQRGMASAVSKWRTSLARLPACHQRLLQVQIEQADWRQILRTYDTPHTLFFVDPPYLPAARREGGYAHELTPEDHTDLLAALQQVQGLVLLCGYPHPTYAALEAAGWTCARRTAVSAAVGRTRGTGLQGAQSVTRNGQQRHECVWSNPAAQQARRQQELFTPAPFRSEPYE